MQYEEVVIDANSFALRRTGHCSPREAEPGADRCFGFTRDMLASMAGFVAASELERKCIYAIVSSTVSRDLEVFREAFVMMDHDRDGRLLRRDMKRTLEFVCQQFSLYLNADAVFRSADLGCLGTVNFLQFAAACLHSQLSPMDSWLAKETFEALDSDKDGYLNAADVTRLFGELPYGLPPKGRFAYNVWHRVVCKNEVAGGKASMSRGISSSLSGPRSPSRTFLELIFGGCASDVREGDSELIAMDLLANSCVAL
eukprot:TRINITY_DN11554_c0_g1_i3.p1 TRINITY_DN11554_c0_g1~~TRINITY_DN11554_c0_g1_i3.p1  ORF type:complete len:256 (+),score=39.28 TRINITY_DN11554_c0_g1_i3:119-886(+)